MLTQDVRWKRSRGKGDKFDKSCWGQFTDGLKGQTNYLDFIHKAIFRQKNGQHCVPAVVEWMGVNRRRLETE